LRKDITEKFNIALDGPAGSGKSTVAKILAADYNILYLDTGAMYRACGLKALRMGIDPKDEAAVLAALPEIEIELSHGEDGLQRMTLNDCDVTEAIRLPHISLCASAVSAHPGVRAFLLEMQRELARTNNVIMDGRDIGTVVLPEAEVKVFLTASPEARAQRRMKELEKRGTPQPFEEVLRDIQQRDYNDSNRAAAPLKQAEDAVLLDTGMLNFEESLAALLNIIREKVGA
jgi:cytidylate kinase